MTAVTGTRVWRSALCCTVLVVFAATLCGTACCSTNSGYWHQDVALSAVLHSTCGVCCYFVWNCVLPYEQ